MYQSRFPALELEHNVKIVLPHVVYSTDRSVFVVVKGNVPAAVVAVKNHLYKLLSECMGGITTNLDKLPPSPDAATCTNHVFVDNSNLYWGCQDADSPDTKVQVSFRKVSAWVEGGRPTATRFVSGTMPSPVEEKWRQLGYTVLSSASDAGGHVDETLHAKILDAVVMNRPGRAIILSGDGNWNNGGTSFARCAYAALRQGWFVEVVAWKRTCSGVYNVLQSASGNRLSVRFLDDVRDEVTWKRPFVHAVAAGGGAAGAGAADDDAAAAGLVWILVLVLLLVLVLAVMVLRATVLIRWRVLARPPCLRRLS